MSSSDDDDVYTFLFGVALVLVLLTGTSGFLVWLAGQLSGLLAGGGWPGSSPRDALGIAFAFVRDPGDPHGAWPSGAAAVMGPAWVFFLLLAALFALTAVGMFFLVRLILNARRHRPIRRLRLGFASGW
ncbi:hypothetical protein ACFQ07_11050, partial [Actinomadura adrarensis]